MVSLSTWPVATAIALTVTSVDAATARLQLLWLRFDFHLSMRPYGSRFLINLTHLPPCHFSMYFHSKSPPYNSLIDSNDEAVVTSPPPRFTSFEENPFCPLVYGKRDATKSITIRIPVGLGVLRDVDRGVSEYYHNSLMVLSYMY